jgi:hypothetical protein
LATTYLDFFEAAAENKNVDKQVDAMVNVLQQLGLNATFIKELGEARKALIQAINHPNCADLQAKVDRFLEVLHRLYQSQPGMEDFPESKKLRKNPKNHDFFNLIDRLFAAIASLPKDPQSFTFDANSAAKIARVIFLASEVEIDCSSS